MPIFPVRAGRTARTLVGLALTVCTLNVLPACAQEGPLGASWAFEHPLDTYKADAVLDLRYLNEKVAGESGFIQRTPDGNGFALGNGKPVRFWAVGTDIYRQSPEDMARHARFLAKLGVNMIRLHTQIASAEKDSAVTDVNTKEIDGIWRCVAAMKKEGIYTTISPYWATGKSATNWGIAGYTGTTDLWGLLFFNERLQTGYKAWIKALYAAKNPYTGIPLAQDPAVGVIEVQNEDSLFFWTTQGLKPEQQEKLGIKFGQWLVKKYGSLDAARKAWDGTGNDKDNFAQGIVGLNLVWPMTQQLSGGYEKRVDDETQFYAETQRKFYADIADYYRNTLGCKQLINAANWTTADPIRLNDLERWTYTAADVIAVNKYTGGVHTGDNNGWRIDPGHHFTDDSCLLDPRNLPTNLKQVVGHPMIITESTWVSPEGYQTEAPFLIAAYESLTGIDTYYWFAAGGTPEYDPDPYFNFLNLNGQQHPLNKWTCATPALMGGFPAAALMFRMGYIQQGEPVVHEERSLQDMWQRNIPMIAEDRSFDPNRYTGNTGAKSNIQKGIDPLAFMVGPVEVKYGGDPTKSTVADLTKYIDHDKKTVKSVTGQISLDYGNGLCTLNAPKAQGASGFLSKMGVIKLSDITLRSGNTYATVMVVSMDGKPLNVSHKILVQVGTKVRPTNWDATPSDFKGDDGKQVFHGFEIVNTGTPPWRIANTDVTLTLKNPNITKAVLLNTSGYMAQELSGSTANGAFSLKLPPNTMYMVLE